MSTATARAEFGAALSAALPDFVVFPSENEFHETVKPSLFFERSRIVRLPQAPRGAYLNSFRLILVVSQDAGEDALDEALDDLLDALADETQTSWDSADRGVYEDQYPCYILTLTTPSLRS